LSEVTVFTIAPRRLATKAAKNADYIGNQFAGQVQAKLPNQPGARHRQRKWPDRKAGFAVILIRQSIFGGPPGPSDP